MFTSSIMYESHCTCISVTMDESKVVRKANDKATKAGRYSYDSVLGGGGFGKVLKAQDKLNNDVVAVKIIKAKKSIVEFFLFMKPASGERGRREVDLLIDLQHDNIVAIRDHFEFKRKQRTTGLAIVMEYCPGGDLDKRLKKLVTQGKRLTEEERLRWYKQLALALEYLHRSSIAHRDLKPANILVDTAGNLKVADVGLAKALYDGLNTGGSFQQYMKTACGSYPYMAPEVFGGHYTTDSDIFSMGLVMFVICELPKDLTPTCQGYSPPFLGPVLYINRAARTEKATSLLNAQKCPSDEMELFDSMLQYNYHNRPTAAVVKWLKEIEERRERRRREEEERRRREEEERRRREEEERRRREEERREQAQPQGLWGWLKSWWT